jgi:hypothetical protein
MESFDMKCTTVLDRLLQRAFRAKDEGVLANIREEGEQQLDQAEGTENHVHVHLPSDAGTATPAAPASPPIAAAQPAAQDQEIGRRLSTLESAMKDLGTRFDAFEQRLAGNPGAASETGDSNGNGDGEAERAHEMPAGGRRPDPQGAPDARLGVIRGLVSGDRGDSRDSHARHPHPDIRPGRCARSMRCAGCAARRLISPTASRPRAA